MKYIRSFLIVLSFLISGQIFAFHELDSIEIIKNDKEALISFISKRKIKKIKKKYKDLEFNQELKVSFYKAVQDYLNNSLRNCELNLIGNFESELKSRDIKVSMELISEYLKVLRIQHSIDDLLLEHAIGANKDFYGLRSVESEKPARFRGLKLYSVKKLLRNNDIKDLYRNFDTWPDEDELCAYQEFVWLRQNLTTTKERPSVKKKLKTMKRLNREALKQKLISSNAFRKLEYIRKNSFIHKRYIWLKEYFNVILKAKNKMRPVSYEEETFDITKEDEFSSTRVKRFSKLTQRKLLYEKYNETQIILMAQAFQKASRRMGNDPDVNSGVPVIIQEFEVILENGEKTNYVERIELDPQSQYNLARKRLRKDILDLQVMDIFVKAKISYSDVVMAALETGYISLEEIEFVVKYDDLWNPETTKFKRIMSFIFNTARVVSFFIPPPYNVTASLALTIIEGIIDVKTKDGADNDNPATFID